ncbi:MAG: DUF4156 domain-containing protein [Myxococcales bacterium]|nr:MAG: DUF4156 domain-containing protein [Myxococcales bacterium]
MRRRIARSAVAALAAFALACTWVKLNEGGQAVRVAKQGEAASCEAKGRTHAQTTDRVVIFARRDPPIQLELESLARNEAALMGGDTIVPAGPIESGRQTFEVYRCAK